MTYYIIEKFNIDDELIYSETFSTLDKAKFFYQGALLDSLFNNDCYFELWYFGAKGKRLMNCSKIYNFNDVENY